MHGGTILASALLIFFVLTAVWVSQPSTTSPMQQRSPLSPQFSTQYHYKHHTTGPRQRDNDNNASDNKYEDGGDGDDDGDEDDNYDYDDNIDNDDDNDNDEGYGDDENNKENKHKQTSVAIGEKKAPKAATEDLRGWCSLNNTPVPCLDLATCQDTPMPEKYAFVFVHTLDVPLNIDQTISIARRLALLHPKADIVLLLGPSATHPLTPKQQQRLQTNNVTHIKTVTYPNVHPNIKKFCSKHKNCCGWKEYIKLALFQQVEYEAAIYLDTDLIVLHHMNDIFKCVKSGYVLSTSGPKSPFNGGFLAVKPSLHLYDMMQSVLKTDAYSDQDGWRKHAFADTMRSTHKRYTYGAEGPQGFFYYFFYQEDELNSSKDKPTPVQLNRCVYNYQNTAKACLQMYDGSPPKPRLVHKHLKEPLELLGWHLNHQLHTAVEYDEKKHGPIKIKRSGYNRRGI
eukprot:m.138261 g.138261  ORF g.138261 m.138261 type:complete len:454 (+) comp24031_c0_seq3:137-1498(+)